MKELKELFIRNECLKESQQDQWLVTRKIEAESEEIDPVTTCEIKDV